MTTNFKTCLFGGFNREDVIQFIENSAAETRRQMEALESENAQLKTDSARMEDGLRTLHAQVTRQEQESVDAEELGARLAQCMTELEVLRKENAELRGPAAEYRNMKDHIAEIEISAHKRTEEFRASAISEMRQLIAKQRDWCTRQRDSYVAVNDGALQCLRRAEQSVENADFSGFDTMLTELQQLEDHLQ